MSHSLSVQRSRNIDGNVRSWANEDSPAEGLAGVYEILQPADNKLTGMGTLRAQDSQAPSGQRVSTTPCDAAAKCMCNCGTTHFPEFSAPSAAHLQLSPSERIKESRGLCATYLGSMALAFSVAKRFFAPQGCCPAVIWTEAVRYLWCWPSRCPIFWFRCLDCLNVGRCQPRQICYCWSLPYDRETRFDCVAVAVTKLFKAFIGYGKDTDPFGAMRCGRFNWIVPVNPSSPFSQVPAQEQHPRHPYFESLVRFPTSHHLITSCLACFALHCKYRTSPCKHAPDPLSACASCDTQSDPSVAQ